MLLERVEIVGFRGINRLSLQLEQNNVLIGENAWGKSSLLDALTLLLSPEENLYHFVHDDFWFPPGDVNGRKTHLHIILTVRESETCRHALRRFRPMWPCWVPGEDGFQRIFYRLESEMAQNDGVLTLREFLNEKGNPLNLLDLPRSDGIDSQGYMNTFYKDYLVRIGEFEARVELPEAVHLYREVPGDPILATRVAPKNFLNDNVLEEYALLVGLGQEENLVVGYHKPRGDGSLTLLGVPASPELVREIHNYLNIPIPARPRNGGVQTALYQSGSSHYLIVLNNGWEDKATEILLDPSEFTPGRYGVRDLLREDKRILEVQANQAIRLTAFTPKKNGALLEIKPLD